MRLQRYVCIIVMIVLVVLIGGGGKNTANAGLGRSYYEKRGDIVWDCPTGGKELALTFDDGPDAVYTPLILRLLADYRAPATFFVVGKRVAEHPSIVKTAFDQGHEIANHTFSHPIMGRTSHERVYAEVEQTTALIQSICGKRPGLFRPPGGYYDNPALIQGLRKRGYHVILWSWHQDTRDWSNPGVQAIVRKVLKSPRDGDILLFHDHGGDRSQTVEALRKIVPALQKQGFHFVTLSQLLQSHRTQTN